LTLWVAAGLAAASVGLGVLAANARAEGLSVGLVPVAVVAIGWLIASNRAVLVFAAFGLCLLAPLPVTDPLPPELVPPRASRNEPLDTKSVSEV